MLPSYYEFFCPVKIVSGHKALSHLPYEMELLGVTKALVVTDPGVVKAGLISHLDAAMHGAPVRVEAVFDETPVDSSNMVVNRVAQMFRDRGCDGLIAVGGGSCIDTAKAANIVLSEGTDDLLKFQGADRLTKPMRPLIVIPTTAGTGSEVTLVAVVRHDQEDIKMPFVSDKLYPALAILDPKMTQTMPPRITAATGMDALTHAIEAFYCLQKNPVSDAFAKAAVRLIFENIERAADRGEDEDARLAMANGAMLAGIAFSNAMVGCVHSLSHAAGGACHVPHGVANAILLPYGMEYNLDKSAALIGELAPEAGLLDPPTDPRDRAKAVIEAVRALGRRLNTLSGLPTRLRDAGIPEDKLPEIARGAINDGSAIYNPEELTEADALAVLKKAY